MLRASGCEKVAREGRSRHGTLISWGYFDYGVIGWVPEHWGGFGKDLDGDKRVSEKEQDHAGNERDGFPGALCERRAPRLLSWQ